MDEWHDQAGDRGFVVLLVHGEMSIVARSKERFSKQRTRKDDTTMQVSPWNAFCALATALVSRELRVLFAKDLPASGELTYAP